MSPEVGSRMVWPGSIAPCTSASSIMYLATRSLTEPGGIAPSSLAQSFISFGVICGSSTSGVLPIASRTFSKCPPQGRFSSGSVAISPHRILQKVKYRRASRSDIVSPYSAPDE